jgi:hypothetical protein
MTDEQEAWFNELATQYKDHAGREYDRLQAESPAVRIRGVLKDLAGELKEGDPLLTGLKVGIYDIQRSINKWEEVIGEAEGMMRLEQPEVKPDVDAIIQEKIVGPGVTDRVILLFGDSIKEYSDQPRAAELKLNLLKRLGFLNEGVTVRALQGIKTGRAIGRSTYDLIREARKATKLEKVNFQGKPVIIGLTSPQLPGVKAELHGEKYTDPGSRIYLTFGVGAIKKSTTSAPEAHEMGE